MQTLKSKLIILASILFGMLTFSPVLVSALDCSNPQTAQDQIKCGAGTAAGNTGNNNAPKTLQDTIASVINILSAAAGIIAVIMIIVGGLRYVTSAGNPEGAKNARNTILYAVIGLGVVALAQIVVHFVLHNTSKATGG
jgi:hypothetical protein